MKKEVKSIQKLFETLEHQGGDLENIVADLEAINKNPEDLVEMCSSLEQVFSELKHIFVEKRACLSKGSGKFLNECIESDNEELKFKGFKSLYDFLDSCKDGEIIANIDEKIMWRVQVVTEDKEEYRIACPYYSEKYRDYKAADMELWQDGISKHTKIPALKKIL